MMKLILMLLFCMGMAVAQTAFGEPTLYRFTDPTGRVFYSDRLPPGAEKHEHEVFNADGRRIGVVDRELSPEEWAKRMAEEREREARAREDEILLKSFASEHDILIARQDRMSTIDATITVTQAILRDLNTRKAELTEQARRLRESGRNVPGHMTTEIESLFGQVDENQAHLTRKRAEREEAERYYDWALNRFRELRLRSVGG